MNQTVLLALVLMAIIVMMILPVPAWILDVGLATSFALAILIFSITLFIEEPLDFSIFPTVLLTSLMLRLALNVSSTKLIIGDGHTGTRAAGDVIEGFASFVMSGNLLQGLVVFGVLMIVNFIVITKGAARMAEVGARFALDGMPGRQLAIDSDMSAGAIDHNEAKARREREQQEASFLGSLDGASKFVKGDAVAGLLITLLNLIVGLIMGLAVHGMPAAAALETYAILTVGDGLVTQIPAVIISIAAALLLARGGAQGATDSTLTKELSRHPAALITVSVLMAGFAIIPGLPFLPFMFGSVCLGVIGLRVRRSALTEDNEGKNEPSPELSMAEPILGDVLELDDLHLEFAPDLVRMVLDQGTGLDSRIGNMRTYVATEFGLLLPEIRLTDRPDLNDGTYVIKVQGVEQARGVLHPDMIMALTPAGLEGLPSGQDVAEPVYGAPARWISSSVQEDAAMAGATIVSPPEILATHLLEVIKRNLGRLLTVKSLRRHLTELTQLSDQNRAASNQKMLDDLIPDKVPLDSLHAVLRLLLEERVSIRNMPLILESIAEARLLNSRPESICERVRHRLGFQLVSDLKRSDGTIPLVQLASDWEETFKTYQIDAPDGVDVALPPEMFTKLAQALGDKLREVGELGHTVAVVTTTQRRRYLHAVLKSQGLTQHVLSFEEIGLEAKPVLVGVVPA